jgi:hydroxyquinol 1,2-dioxygenase
MYAQEKDVLDRKPVPEIRSFTKQSVTEDNLTDVVLERWKDIPDPRLRQIMQSLIKHLHGFVREIEPTKAEWATAIDWLSRTGQMC